MQNYLQRLVQQQVDPVLPTLEPRIASRFEQPFATLARGDQLMDLESNNEMPLPNARTQVSDDVTHPVQKAINTEPLSIRPAATPTGFNEEFANRLSHTERLIRQFQIRGSQPNIASDTHRPASSVGLPSLEEQSKSWQSDRVLDESKTTSPIKNETSDMTHPSIEIRRELLQPTNVYNSYSNTTQVMDGNRQDREFLLERRTTIRAEAPLPRTPFEPKSVMENSNPTPRVPTMERHVTAIASKQSTSAPVIATEQTGLNEQTGNTVHVTIGRIEIRTPKKAVEAPQPMRKPNASKIMSLDDYVQSRRGGRG